MPAYFIVDLEITDPAGFEEYRQLVPATIQQYGGRYVVRGGTDLLDNRSLAILLEIYKGLIY